jgi:hypothetical protein
MSPRLVPMSVARDVVEQLEQLLEGAKAGRVVGLAFAAALRGGDYFVGAVGECHRDPTRSRGMVAAIDDELRVTVQERAQADTTLP